MKKIIPFTLCFSLGVNAAGPEDLFLGMKEHSDQVKVMIGEDLKYAFPTETLRKKLLVSKGRALKVLEEDDQGGIGDIFDFFRNNSNSIGDRGYDPRHAAWQIKNYQTKMENYKSGNLSNGLNRAAKAGIVMSGAVYGATLTGPAAPVGAAIGTAVGFAASELSDAYYGWVQTQNLTKISNQMAGVILNAVKEEESYLLENISSESLKEINERYDLQDTLNQLEVCEDCSPEFESHLRNGLMKNLTNLSKLNALEIKELEKGIEEMKVAVEGNTNRFEVINNEMKKIGNDVKDIADAVNSIQTEVDNLQTTILENQNDINEQLGSISNQVSENFTQIMNNGQAIEQNRELILENRKDLNFVKDFAYSQMSPGQKLIALESGAYGKNMLAEKRELLIKQLSFQTNVGNFLNGARQVSQIANNLGVDLGPFNQVLNYGQTAFNVANELLSPSPNFLGMAVQITGLFAKRRDIQGERHSQIMKSLGIINKKLDVVLENQQKLFEGQARILEGLSQISAQIQDVAITLYDNIELTRLDIRTNRSGIREGLKESHTSCNTFLSRLDKELFKPLDRSPMALRKRHFNTYKEFYIKCRSIINTLDLLRQNGEFSVLFTEIFNDVEDETSLSKYLKQHYLPLVESYLKFAPEGNIERDLLMGIEPFINPVQLKKAFDNEETKRLARELLSKEQWKDNDRKPLNLVKLLKNPLDAKTVFEVGENINRLAPYFDIVKDNEFPTTQEVLSQEGAGNISIGHYALLDIQTLTEVSLIQKSFLSGQAIIPYLYQSLLSGHKTAEIVDVLEKYSNIKENFIAYFVSNQLANKYGRDLYAENNMFGNSYERALDLGKERYLEIELGTKEIASAIVKCDENKDCFLHITAGDKESKLFLRSFKTQSGLGLLRVHPQSEKLLGLREVTMNNLFGYNYESNVENKNDRLNYRFMLFMGSPERPMEKNNNFEREYEKL